MLELGSDVEPFAAAEVPSFLYVWIGVNDDGAFNWSYMHDVEVEGPNKVHPRRHFWCNPGLPEEVEC